MQGSNAGSLIFIWFFSRPAHMYVRGLSSMRRGKSEVQLKSNFSAAVRVAT